MKFFVFIILLVVATNVTSQSILGIISSRQCPFPKIPRNGRITFTGRGSLRTSSLAYICNTNYRLVGFPANICKDRQWVFETPTCEEVNPCSRRRVCGLNAQCIPGGGQSFSCVCDQGYSGDATRRCIRNCPTPNTGFRSTFSPIHFSNEYGDGYRITWYCEVGYTERSRTTIVQTCRSGIWFGSRPTCFRNTCSPPSAPTNGHVEPNYPTWITGDLARFSCDDGYELTGSSSIRCSSSNSFDSSPSCTDVDECMGDTECGENAYCMNTQGSYICLCNDGYEGNGRNCNDTDECNDDIRCSSNSSCVNTAGSFVCVCNDGYNGMDCIDSCDLPEIPEDLVVQPMDQDVFFDGEMVMFSCSENMTLVGNETLFCEDGEFGPVPFCMNLE